MLKAWVKKHTTRGVRMAVRRLIFELRAQRRNRDGVRRVRRITPPYNYKLQLGSGSVSRPGWINVDLFAEGADYSLDLREVLPLPDNSAAVIYSAHVLEHFDYPGEVRPLLRECLRILQPAGLFTLAVPDCGRALVAYVERDVEFFSFWRPRSYLLQEPTLMQHAAQGFLVPSVLVPSVCPEEIVNVDKLLAEAAEDLDYAENVPPPGSGGRIFGRVGFFEEDLLERRKSRETYPAGKVLTLRDSSGATLALQTDSEGRFEATGMKPGDYAVSLDAPDSARVYYHPATIELKDRGCVPVDVSYQPNGRISGRIVDANGRAASRVPVSAFPSQFTSKEDYPHVSMHTKWTDSDGRYEIGPLPPGAYHVGINVELPARLESPYPPTYFPGVRTRGDAKAVAIREGEVHRADFVLPQRLAQVTISGSVVLPDGTPAPNVGVNLIAGTVLATSSTRTDASGSFTVTGLSGSTYLLRASFYASRDNNGSAETSVSLSDEAVVGLKLILQKR